MHNKKISWNYNWIFIFICFVGRLLLSTSSSSSFITTSFLIQMLLWIRGSSIIQFFIFLITWGIFFESWELDLQFLPSYFLLLWVEIFLVCTLPRVSWRYSLPSGTHSSNEWIPWSWETIQGGYHHFCILHFFFYLFRLFFILYLHILQLLFQIHLLFMLFPTNSLVKESNIFNVFREETCDTSWSMIESTMISLALTKFFLCKDSALSPSGTGTFPLM